MCERISYFFHSTQLYTRTGLLDYTLIDSNECALSSFKIPSGHRCCYCCCGGKKHSRRAASECVLGGTKFVKKLISGEERAKTLFPSTETFATHTHFEVRDYIIYPPIRTWPNKMISLLFLSPLSARSIITFLQLATFALAHFCPLHHDRVNGVVQQSERLHRQTGSKLVNEREPPESKALFLSIPVQL
jgi:hypothetical protein